jgi:Spy/CpxP family protein refolding chaperone
MNRKMVGLVALAALLIATPLMAQERQGRRGGQFGRGGFGGVTKAQLLQNENVQKELELVDDQKQQLASIAEEARQGRGGRGGFDPNATPEERAKAREERMARQREIDKKIETVLLAPQKTRLNEIYVQALGSMAFSDEAIAKELGIGPDLQERIADARREAFQGAFQNIDQDATPEERRAAMAKIQAEAEKNVLALLSPDQQAKFEKMKGKKVDFELNVFGRGGRGGRRGGGDN